MKKTLSVCMAAAFSVLVSLIGITPQAKAAPGTTSSINISFDSFEGFSGGFSGGQQNDDWSNVQLYITSATHRVNHVSTFFRTEPSDPSEATGFIYVNGIKDASVSTHEYSFSTNLDFAQSSLLMTSGVSQGFVDDNGAPSNAGFGSINIRPFDLTYGWMSYQEYSWGSPAVTGFQFICSFGGTFGPGAEGDARGMPYRAVPTPGALSLAGLGALAAFRRIRRR